MSWVWLVTMALWGAVVYRDWRREPRDGRWIVSLLGWVALGYLTRNGMREVTISLVLLDVLAIAFLAGWMAVDLRARMRRARLETWAREKGFEAVAIAPKWAPQTLPEGLRRLPMLAKGRAARTANLLRREEADGGETLVFENAVRRPVAWYDLDGAEARGTVVAIRRPGLWLPQFQVRPVGLLAGMDGGAIGDAVATTPGTAFARSYRLGGHEVRNLRALFGDDLLALIAERPGWLIEGEGEWLAAFYYDRAENLMSLRTSTLRVVGVESLEDHVRDVYRVLGALADRGSRSQGRGAGAA